MSRTILYLAHNVQPNIKHNEKRAKLNVHKALKQQKQTAQKRYEQGLEILRLQGKY